LFVNILHSRSELLHNAKSPPTGNSHALREGPYVFKWLYKRPNKTTFVAEAMLTRMELDGEVFILGSIRDISVRKRLEKEIQDRRNDMDILQKSQVAMQSAAAIAHELNQPLLVVTSYAKAALLLLNTPNPDIHKIRKTIEKSKQQALRAGRSMRDLLDYLSMKEFPIESFDLPLVQANRTHVQRTLTNLLHNGIQAMQQAKVPLPAITVTVRTIKDKSVAQVTIQDNGPGVNNDVIQHLFEPFFTTKPGGIGMGLAISRSLIELNGGQLWFDPEEGPGATFHLTLPFAP
jgi:two-component system, LuxR family, sensor kinase FixL